MQWTELITAQAESAYKAAETLIGKVDDAKLDWKPDTGSNWLTVGSLIRHLTTACGATARGFVTGEWDAGESGIDPEYKPSDEHPMPPAEFFLGYGSKREALDALAQDKALTLAMLEQAGEDRLASERSAPPWGGHEQPLGAHFLLGVQHLHAHKSQLFYYLK